MSKVQFQGAKVVSFKGMNNITFTAGTTIEAGQEIHLGVQYGNILTNSATFVVGGRAFQISPGVFCNALDIVDTATHTGIVMQNNGTGVMYSISHDQMDIGMSGGAYMAGMSGDVQSVCKIDPSWVYHMEYNGTYGASGMGHALPPLPAQMAGVSGSNYLNLNVAGVVINGNVDGTPQISLKITTDMLHSHIQISATEGVILEGSKIGEIEIGASSPIKVMNVMDHSAQISDAAGSYALIGTHFPPQQGDMMVTIGDTASHIDCH